ncbi:MAG TPA: hypothetical protein VEK84_14125 [Terriglobales bacterium]|nr:hypothetical protein [Terriglobales bacterium]
MAALVFLPVAGSVAQSNSAVPTSPADVPVPASAIALHQSSRRNIVSEMGGAFMGSSKCDPDGNLYIRKYASDRPLLGPVVKIDSDGKRTALFDPVAFSQLALDRADAFSPASDGGLYQIAQSGVVKPRIYVLHFSSDGSPSSPIRLEADFEVYSFAAFLNGNLLVSGFERDVQNPKDAGRAVTEVFSADGRVLAQLSFDPPPEPAKTRGKPRATASGESAPTLDLADAEVGVDGNLYAMRNSSPALVYVISPAGKVVRTLKVKAPAAGALPGTFHVSSNRLAVSFPHPDSKTQTLVVADAQTGLKVATYVDPGSLGSSFACYSADEGVFTFLALGEGNALEVIRAEAR